MSCRGIGNRGVGALAALMLAVAVLSVAGVGGAVADGETGTSYEVQNASSVDIADGLEAGSPDGPQTVIVRMEEAEEPSWTSSGGDIQSHYQQHAEETQSGFKQFADSEEGVSVEESFWLANAMVVTVDTNKTSFDEVARVDGVVAIHPNFEGEFYSASATRSSTGTYSTTTGVNTTYGVDMVGAPAVWEAYDTQGASASVVVIDSGVDVASHSEDLNLTGWAEFDAAGDREETTPNDPVGHGTHVTGTVAAGNASGQYLGVAPNVELYHAKVADDTMSGSPPSFAATLSALEWAVQQDADVATMSLGFGRYNDFMVEPLRNARSQGVFLVASAGNAGVYTSSTPANAPETMAVGAVDNRSEIAAFSSGEVADSNRYWADGRRDGWPDEYVVPAVSAPGVGVNSTAAGGGYQNLSGTSMAAPHVAGTAALVQAATDRDLSPAELEAAIAESATHPNADDPFAVDTGQDIRYGYGIVDAYHAVSMLAADSNVSGVVTDADGNPVEGATVSAETGVTTQTNADGEYTLTLPSFEQSIEVRAVGFAANRTTVTPPAENRNVTLADPVAPDFELVDGPADHIDPNAGETSQLTFDVANTDTVTVRQADTRFPADQSNLTLSVDGQQAGFGQAVTVSGNDTVTIELAADNGTTGWVALDVEFTDGNGVENGTVATTRIHPDPLPVTASQDIHDQVALAAPGATVELVDDTYQQPVQNRMEGPSNMPPTGIAVTEPVTITAADGVTPTVEFQPAADGSSEQLGLSAVATNDVVVSDIAFVGHDNLTLGVEHLYVAGSSTRNTTVENASVGVLQRFVAGGVIADNEVRDTDVAINARGGSATISANAVDEVPAEDDAPAAGIVAAGVNGEVAHNEVRGSAIAANQTGISVVMSNAAVRNNSVERTDAGVVSLFSPGAVTHNRVNNTTLGIVTQLTGAVSNNTVTNAEFVGIRSVSSLAVRNNEVHNTNGSGISVVGIQGDIAGNRVSNTTARPAVVAFTIGGNVTDNTVRNTTGPALTLGRVPLATNNTITGTNGSAIAIRADTGAVVNNDVSDADRGVTVTSAANASDANTTVQSVAGNDLAGVGRGISIRQENTTVVSVRGNYIETANRTGVGASVGVAVHNGSVPDGVSRNAVVTNGTGIHLDGKAHAFENSVVNASQGILVTAPRLFVGANEVRNAGVGIHVRAANTSVQRNVVERSGVGLRVNGVVGDTTTGGTDVVVRGNEFRFNAEAGILLEDTRENLVYNNVFNNTNNHALDNGTATWNTTRQNATNIVGGPTVGGNYWAHPESEGFSENATDEDGDGVVDQSYELNADNVDQLPLAGSGPRVTDYANSNGVVDTSGLRNAVQDWRTGDIDTQLLRDVIAAWRSGETVE